MHDDPLQHRLDELYAECENDPADVARLYLDASFRRLRRSSDAVRRATEALTRKLGSPPADADEHADRDEPEND